MPLVPPGAVWKRSTSACRASAFTTLPSMRQKFHPRALTAACTAQHSMVKDPATQRVECSVSFSLLCLCPHHTSINAAEVPPTGFDGSLHIMVKHTTAWHSSTQHTRVPHTPCECSTHPPQHNQLSFCRPSWKLLAFQARALDRTFSGKLKCTPSRTYVSTPAVCRA